MLIVTIPQLARNRFLWLVTDFGSASSFATACTCISASLSGGEERGSVCSSELAVLIDGGSKACDTGVFIPGRELAFILFECG